MSRRMKTAAVLITLCSCVASPSGPGTGGGPGPSGGNATPEAAAVESALTAEEAVEHVTELLGDVGGFVGDGFAGFGAGGGGGGGWQDWLDGGQLPLFEGPAGCTAEVSLMGGEISLASDCTMASGRHVEGSLHVGFGSECGPFGLTVQFDLTTESAPGAGDEVRVVGSIDLTFAEARLYLALGLLEEVHLDAVHATEIGACVVVDLPTRVLAIDGSARHTVDGQQRHGLRIEDLQASLCEHPPYTGDVRMSGPVHNVEVGFERPAPDEARITVVADGARTEVDLPVLRVPGPLCADLPPVPLAIDYASCGGCGHPDPGGPGDDAGGDLPGGGDGDEGDPDADGDADAPLPGGDPDDALD